MKKFLWTVVIVIVLLGGAVITVPSFIDWNAYKPDIAEQVKKFTGRDLVIAGDLDVQILPAPALIAENVSLSSLEGAESPDLATLRSVEVRIALAPLLGGNVRVETVRLVEPQIYLEVLADGRTSWTIETPKKSEDAAAPAAQGQDAGAAEGGGGPNIILDRFEIVDGRIVYQDAGSATRETVEDVDVNIAAGTLASGPFQIDGTLVFRSLRLGVDARMGEIVSGRTFPLDLAVKVGGDSGVLSLAGTVVGLNEDPRFRGDLTISSPNVGGVVSALANGAVLPAPLSQPFRLAGALDASASTLSLQDFTIDFGGAKGKGSVSGAFNGKPRITVDVNVDKVAADPWLQTAPKSAGAEAPVPAEAGKTASAVAPAPAAASDFSLPKDVTATVTARIGEIALRGDAVRNVALNAELANGEVTLSQFSLQGPGGFDMALFGFLTAKEGKPSFDGELESKVADPHALMTWAQVDTAALKPGKPGALALSLSVNATPDTVSVSKLGVAFDKTKIGGAATIALRDRLGVGATVNVDQINLDDYLADGVPAPEKKPAEPKQDGTATGGATQPQQQAAGPLDALKPLSAFDANVRANVGLLTAQGIPIRKVEADLGLVQGDLTIRKFSVGDVGSLSATVTGALNGLATKPTANALAVRASVADPAKLASLGGIDLPLPAQKIGKSALDLEVNGPLDAPSLVSTLNTLAATLNVNGNLKPFDLVNTFDLGMRLRHTDAAELIRRLGVDYRSAGDIGGLDLSTKLAGGLGGFTFSDLAAAVGAAKINGAGSVELTGARPKVIADLKAGNLTIDPFLPAEINASLAPRPGGAGEARVIPARFWAPESGGFDLKHLIATVSNRWPTEALDLGALNSADANLTFSSPRISYHEYQLDGANLVGSLKDGLLNVEKFTGTVFGGAVTSTAAINAKPAVPTLATDVAVSGMDIGAAAKAAGIAGTTGKLTSRIQVGTNGASVADWVRSLDGKGAIEVRGIKGQSSLNDMPVIGLALGPLMRVFELLNTGLGSLIGAGAKTGLGDTDVTSTFSISNGVVNTKDTKIISNLYEGNVAGDINLPLWSMKVGGDIAVDQGLLGTLLANVAKVPSRIPFELSGDIDKPNVKIQPFGGAASQGGSGIKVPGLDKLEKKAPGVGGLIQGILGGGGGGTAPQQPPSTSTGSEPPSQSGGGSQPPAQQPTQQQQQPANPAQQLLNKLFK